MPRVRLLAAVLAGGLTALGAAAPAVAAELVLPAPVTDLQVLPEVGVLPERLLTSRVPGPVVNREEVEVALAGDGRPEQVTMTQRLSLRGTGDYVVRERGPARAARALDGTVPPVLRRGTVVWQGFSPGGRDLAAELRLDAGLEDERLPLAVTLAFTPAGGGDGAGTLGPGGVVDGAGELAVTLTNRTTRPDQQLPAGDVPAAALAGPLDAALAAARAAVATEEPVPPPPAAGDGLPPALPGTGLGVRVGEVAAPLRVTGTVSVEGADAVVEGPGTAPLPAGAPGTVAASVAGTLSTAPVTVTVRVQGPAVVRLDLLVRAVLDPRSVTPPGGADTWADWAAASPDEDARRAAVDALVGAAASAAVARAYSPYLGADLPGADVRTTFRYVLAEAPEARLVARGLEVRPGAVAVAGVALLLVVGNAVGVWRSS